MKNPKYFVVLRVDGVFEYHRYVTLKDAMNFASENPKTFIDIETPDGDLIYDSMKVCVIQDFKYTEFRCLIAERVGKNA